MKLNINKTIIGIFIFAVVFVLGFVFYIFFGESPRRTPDMQRISDVRMLSLMLELYKKDNKVYPKSLDQIVPKYTAKLPLSPNNSNKACVPEQNKYKYTLLPNGEYQIEFCLSEPISTYNAGMNILTSEHPAE